MWMLRIFSFLRSLSSSCLARQRFLRPWARQSFSLSALSRFILTQRRRVSFFLFILALCCFLPLGISKVSASPDYQDTATPAPSSTPTWEPLFHTSTPKPTEDYTCPNPTQGIQGFGQITPFPSWNWNCNDCVSLLTPSPSVTPIATSTGTPYTPTSTVTRTITPTVAQTLPPTATPYGDLYQHRSTSFSYGSYSNTSGSWSCSSADNVNTTGPTYCSGYWTSTGTNQYSGSNGKVVTTVYNSGTKTMKLYYALSLGGATYAKVGTSDVTSNPSGDITLNVGQSKVFEIGYTYGPYGSNNASPAMDFRLYPILTPTPTASNPTPTITPTPVSSYCSSVNGLSDMGVDPFALGILPTVRVGPSSCTTMQGTTIDLGAVSWLPGLDIDEVTVPTVSLCVRMLDLSRINLFGLVIDLDNLALFIAFAFVIRQILKG